MNLGSPAGHAGVPKRPAAVPRVICEMSVAAQGVPGRPVLLRMRLANAGTGTLHLLTWNTPFEGEWFGAFVDVFRDGQPLAYQGPMVKRGDPQADEYLPLPAGRSRQATLDLARAFDLTRPGHYRVVPTVGLTDVVPGVVLAPRTRASFQALALDCPPMEFTLR